jgi:hypothetical protein
MHDNMSADVSYFSYPCWFAELLIKSGADTSGVPSIKARLTCPDCKRLVARYNL